MSHVKLAISPARRPALAGDMASKPSGLHLEMVICQFESSQPSHTGALGAIVLHAASPIATMQFYCSAVSMTSATQKPKSSP